MRKLVSLISMALIVALAVMIPLTALAAGKSHNMKVEIVSIDAKAKTITVKDEKGESHTAPLLGKAISETKDYKAGDKVTVTCKDNEKGDHEGVTSITKG